MRIPFEIKSQIGLTRIGKISIENFSINTPNIIFPSIHKSVNGLFFHENEKIVMMINDAIKIIDPPFIEIINSIPFPLKENNNSIKNGEIVKKSIKQSPLFSESLEMWGINTFPNQPPQLNKLSEMEIPIENNIPILSDNFPNSYVDRYTDYMNHAQNLRLKAYEDLIFPKYPNQLFILDIEFSDELTKLTTILPWLKKNQKNFCGIRLTNLFENMMGFKTILEWIFILKRELPSDMIWILGGQIWPQDFTLVFYLGFDLIDIRELYLAGQNGLYISRDDRKWLRELHNPLCGCAACTELNTYLPLNGQETQELRNLICAHDIYAVCEQISIIKQYVYDGTFRNYLEKMIHSNTFATAMLRTLDNLYAEEINSRFPLNNNISVKCIGTESYKRPEIVNFIQRLKSEVTPAKFYPIIVLLPCAAKKPYSDSRSHILFQKIIRRASGKHYSQIHQVIVTSPLGIVPRELEEIFPAAHYDIPVTGEWDAYEIESTAKCIVDWILKYSKIQNATGFPIQVIAHLSGGYLSACKKAIEIFQMQNSEEYKKFSFIFTEDLNIKLDSIEDNTINRLELVLKKALNELGFDSKTESQNEKKNLLQITDDEIKIRATLDFQFGKGAGDRIIENGAILVKDKWTQYAEIFVFDGGGKTLVGRLYHDSGFIKLAPRGAELLIGKTKNFVQINESTMNGTTVFRPILSKIELFAHPGDEMIVINNEGQYLGVGELGFAPQDAINCRRGLICSLRKKLKASSFSSSQNSQMD